MPHLSVVSGNPKLCTSEFSSAPPGSQGQSIRVYTTKWKSAFQAKGDQRTCRYDLAWGPWRRSRMAASWS